MDIKKIQATPPAGKSRGLSFETLPPSDTELSIHRFHEGGGFFVQFVKMSRTSIENVFYVEAKQVVLDFPKPRFISAKGYITREDLGLS